MILPKASETTVVSSGFCLGAGRSLWLIMRARAAVIIVKAGTHGRMQKFAKKFGE
jgi:hypothetical protein